MYGSVQFVRNTMPGLIKFQMRSRGRDMTLGIEI